MPSKQQKKLPSIFFFFLLFSPVDRSQSWNVLVLGNARGKLKRLRTSHTPLLTGMCHRLMGHVAIGKSSTRDATCPRLSYLFLHTYSSEEKKIEAWSAARWQLQCKRVLFFKIHSSQVCYQGTRDKHRMFLRSFLLRALVFLRWVSCFSRWLSQVLQQASRQYTSRQYRLTAVHIWCRPA